MVERQRRRRDCGRGASSLTISLSAGAGILAEGTNLATIWITNLSNHLAQALAFSLIVQAADYPIAFTGFNDDVVVENTALGGNTPLYADVFDANNAVFHPVSSFCFYESGLPAVNLQGGVAVEGLPASGSFTSAADNMTLFQFGPYDGDNVLYLSAGSASGALTLASPLAYKSLSILAASVRGRRERFAGAAICGWHRQFSHRFQRGQLFHD